MTLKDLSYVIFDLETTGLYPESGDEIIEIGAVVVEGGELHPTEIFHSMVNPGRPIPAISTSISGIKDSDVADAPTIDKILPQFLKFTGNRIWVAQNAKFDLSFIVMKLKQLNIPLRQSVFVDTIGLSKMVFPYETSHSLDSIMSRLNIARSGARHRSVDDSRYTAHALMEFIKMLEQQGVTSLPQIEPSFIKPENLFKTQKPKSMKLFG